MMTQLGERSAEEPMDVKCFPLVFCTLGGRRGERYAAFMINADFI